MIVDAGLDGLAANTIATLTQFVGVGSTSTLPAANQTALFTPVVLGGSTRTSTAHTGNQSVFLEGDYSVYRRAFKFPAATADTILREWGFFKAAAGDIMWNREVFRAIADNTPTDYNVLAGEELVVELDTMMKIPTVDAPGSFTLTTNDPATPTIETSAVVRAACATSTNVWNTGAFGPAVWNSTLSAIAANTAALESRTATPTGTSCSTISLGAYVAGNRYIDVTYTWEPANVTTSIGRILYAYSGSGFNGLTRFQCSLTPVIGKTSSRRYRQTVRFSWGRE
jgi:hypothetical protein